MSFKAPETATDQLIYAALLALIAREPGAMTVVTAQEMNDLTGMFSMQYNEDGSLTLARQAEDDDVQH